MMLFTEYNQNQFEKWYLAFIAKNHKHKVTVSPFYDVPFEFQIGVYLAYFDSLEIDICVDGKSFFKPMGVMSSLVYGERLEFYKTNIGTRNEAYLIAFEKGNLLINEHKYA